jgi:tRNA(Ile)-lysidine synthase
MDVDWPKPGKYVVAVSGGVDSLVLLELLQPREGLELVVAHFDHGIRKDSIEDRKLVKSLAESYGLAFVFEEGHLGAQASEATARTARYDFLRKTKHNAGAKAIITAHHQDDVLETAIINILRGTGRKGLSSLGNSTDIIRPLLKVTKKELIGYAKEHGLVWREDETNQDQKYLRNYVRHNILSRFNDKARAELLEKITEAAEANREIDTLLVKQLTQQGKSGELDRNWFNNLPHGVAKEIMAAWLRSYEIRDFDIKTLERLVVAAKTGKAGQTFPAQKGYSMRVNREKLALTSRER